VPSRTQELQDTIDKLQARLHDLETSAAASVSSPASTTQAESISSWGKRTWNRIKLFYDLLIRANADPDISMSPEPGSDIGDNEVSLSQSSYLIYPCLLHVRRSLHRPWL
jgi:hypothetical protein